MRWLGRRRTRWEGALCPSWGGTAWAAGTVWNTGLEMTARQLSAAAPWLDAGSLAHRGDGDWRGATSRHPQHPWQHPEATAACYTRGSGWGGGSGRKSGRMAATATSAHCTARLRWPYTCSTLSSVTSSRHPFLWCSAVACLVLFLLNIASCLLRTCRPLSTTWVS